jgi:hypothetical protein
MVESIGGGNASGLLSSSMINKSATDEKITVAVAKIGLDAQKAEGEAAMKLIESAAPGKIDVHV